MGTSTSSRGRSKRLPHTRHHMMKGTRPQQGTSMSVRGQPRHAHHTQNRMQKGTSTTVRGQPRQAPHMQHRMTNGTHPTQGFSTCVRGRPSQTPQVKKQMMQGSHPSNGTATSFQGHSRHTPKVKMKMMQGGRHSSRRRKTHGSHKQMKGRDAGTRALTSTDDQLRQLASKKKPRRIHGQHGPYVRASQNHVRSAMPRHERLRQGVSRPVKNEGTSRGRTRGNAQPSAEPKHHMMARNNVRRSQHGARTGGDGTQQHEHQTGKQSGARGGAHNATRSGAAHKRSFDSRIVGGFLADEGGFKFMTSLFIEDPYNYGYLASICGGSLIAPDVVLTAAHCGVDYTIAAVRVGSNALNSGGDMTNVVSQCLHPSYEA